MSKKISAQKSKSENGNKQQADSLLRAFLAPSVEGQLPTVYSCSASGVPSPNLNDGRSHTIDRLVIYDNKGPVVTLDLIPFDDNDDDEKQSKIKFKGDSIEVKGNIRCLLENDGNVRFETNIEIKNGVCRFEEFKFRRELDFVEPIKHFDPEMPVGDKCLEKKLSAECLRKVLGERRRYATKPTLSGGPRKTLSICFIRRGDIFETPCEYAEVLVPHFALLAKDLESITNSHTLFNIMTGLQFNQRPTLNSLLFDIPPNTTIEDILETALASRIPSDNLVAIQIPGKDLVPDSRPSRDHIDLQIHFYGIEKAGYDFWNEELVKVYAQSQLGNKGGSPASFLPSFARDNRQKWGISYKVLDRSKKNRLEQSNFGFAWLGANNPSDIILTPSAIRLLDGGDLTGQFDLIKTHSGDSLMAVFEVHSQPEGKKWISDPNDFVPASLSYSDFNRDFKRKKDGNKFAFVDVDAIKNIPFQNQRAIVRVGAIDLEFGGILKPKKPDQNTVEKDPKKEQQCQEDSQDVQNISVDFRLDRNSTTTIIRARPQDAEISLQLPLKEFRAGGQDDVLGESGLAQNASLRLVEPCEVAWDSKELRDLPVKDLTEKQIERLFVHRNSLVIDPEAISSATGGDARYLIDVSEKAIEGVNQTLSLDVNEIRSAQSTLSKIAPVILSPTPSLGAVKPSKGSSKKPTITAPIKKDAPALVSPQAVAADEPVRMPLNAIILDSDPFTVAKVMFKQLKPITNQIGTWRNDSGWQLLTQTESFDLVLPPQGIGEEMEKEAGNILPENKLLDFRLSPPARIKLQPSQEKRNFTEPPWNLRRLLAFDGREKGGAEIKHLSFELLYGLSCDSDYPFLRLAEIASRIGLVQGRLPQIAQNEIARRSPDNYKKLRLEWGLIYRKLQSRIAIFEPWHAVQTGSLILNANTVCRIRNKDEGDTPAADMRPPVPVESNANPNPALDPKKLGGGVTWGFESKNIYNAVMRTEPGKVNPESPEDGTEIRDLRFSSLGGWGHTKAGFDKKRTTISADVSMGATYLYKLERIGRIGVWWNLAKHVIVYKRTVLPSRQMDQFQEPLKGRPIIRKVEEYVEILEPVRNYPDGPEAESPEARRSSGFVRACSFIPGARFNVLSRWGQDVGEMGWKVPLWKPYQTPEDLYRKPQVFLHADTTIDGLAKTTPCLILNPDNLYFYTDTRAETDSSPNKWPPIPSVDYVNIPLCKPLEDFTGGDTRQTTPDDSAVHAGYSPCTFSVDTSGLPVDLAANRGLKPMFAELRNITMMRALPTTKPLREWKDLTQPHEKLFVMRQKTAAAFQELLKLIPQIGPGEKINTGQLESLKTNVNASLAQIQEVEQNARNLKDQLLERVSGFSGSLAQQRDKIKAKVKEAESLVFRQIEKQLLNKTKDADGFISTLQREVDTLLALNKAQFDAKKEEFILEARQKFDFLQEGLKMVYIPRSVLTDTLKRTATEFKRGLDTIKREAEAIEAFVGGLGNLPSDKIVEENLRQLRSRLSQVIVLYEKVRAALGNRAFGSALDWLPQISEAKLFSDLNKKVEAELKTIKALLNESSEAVTAEIEVKKQDVLSVLRRVKELVDKNPELNNVEAELHNFEAAAKTVENTIGAFLDVDKPNSWLGQQLNAIGSIPLAAEHAEFNRVCREFRDAIDITKRTAACDPASTNLFGKLQCVEKAVNDASELWIDYVIGSITSAVDEFLNPFSGVAQDLQNKIQDIINNIASPVTTVRRELEKIRDEFVTKAENMIAATVNSITPPTEILAVADSVPRIIRAFGKPPQVPNLSFARPEVAYFYDAADRAIGITPVISRVRQAGALAGDIGDALQPLGIDLPAKAFVESLIPPDLGNFKLSDIFPKFAGLDLTDLFSGIKLPNVGSDAVKVTHGVDPQSRRAWTQANVQVDIAQDCQVFTIGAISVILRKAKFEALMRFEVSPEGMRRVANGKLTGKWDLVVGGTNLVGFKDTTLSFDDSGKFHFNISPLNVELAAALSFISDFLKQFSNPRSGFSVALTPTGVRAILSLPIPPIKSGTSGISNLYLGVAFGIEFGAEGFAITLGFLLGRKDAPFNLAIFLLGGGGYIEVTARYVPSSKSITCSVEIGIAVSASIGINLGVLNGCVEIFLGVNVRFTAVLGSRKTSMKVGMFLLIRGEVSILGIVSAGISLLLETEYENGEFTARGRFRISIKICWCFTLEVDKQVEYKVGGGKGQARLNPAPANDTLAEFKKLRRTPEFAPERMGRRAGLSYQPAVLEDGAENKPANRGIRSAPVVAPEPPVVIDYQKLAGDYVKMVF